MMFESSQDPFKNSQYHPVFNQSREQPSPDRDLEHEPSQDSTKSKPRGSQEATETRSDKTRRRLKLFLFGLVLFVFFFLAKIPQARIVNLILAHLKIATQTAGYALNVKSAELSFLLRPHLTLTDVEVRSLDNEKAVLKIESLYVRPHLFSMLPFVQQKAVSLKLKMLGGEVSGTVAGSSAGMTVDVSLDSLNLTSTTLLKQVLPVEFASFDLSGDLDFSMNFAEPVKNSGSIDFKMKALSLADQNLFGFQLPRINTQDNRFHLKFKNEKINFTEVKIGKDPKKDDVIAELTGDVTVLPVASTATFGLNNLNLQLATHFVLSPALHNAIPFLDSILGSAKSKDGRYSYSVKGNLPIPFVEPAP